MLPKGGSAFGCFARETSNEHYSRAIGLHHLLTMDVQATVIHLIAWSILLATWIYPSREIQGLIVHTFHQQAACGVSLALFRYCHYAFNFQFCEAN